jgi:hypothetical protein
VAGAALGALVAGTSLAGVPAHAQIASGCVYTLVNKASGLALDNEGSKSANNGVWQWSPIAGDTSQEWRITSLGNGKYNLVCLASSMSLDNGGTSTNGAPSVEGYTTSGDTNQQWTITSVGNGYFQLMNATSGLALDNKGSTANGGVVVQRTPQSTSASQQWAIVPASGFVYNLISKTSGLALDNSNNANAGTNSVQWGLAAGNTNQQWRLNYQGNGEYNLINLTSGMALDNGDTTANGAHVLQWYPNGNTNQQWSITNLGDGYYQLICATSGLALDNDNATSNGGSVVQWTPTAGNSNQEWAIQPVQIGANTPFTEYEAEAGALAGGATVVSLTAPPTTEFSSPQLEASGHAYVNLGATGQSVTWTNNTGQNITAINVRYSIPDAPNGGGITSTLDLYVNGQFRQAINVNSVQTWVYETASSYDGMSQSPSAGNPHVFWDEAHTFISGAAIVPGSTITLQKDAANTASYYNIDVIDLETPPAPLTQPANSLSIVSYGAVADNTPTNGAGDPNAVDSSTAIQNCINDAQAQGKSVWIPQGTFYLKANAPLYVNGVTITGAGMWYSTLYTNPTLPASTGLFSFIEAQSATLKNFAIDGNAVDNTTTDGNMAGVDIKGSNWLIDGVWIRHHGAGIWADGTTGTVQNCRLNNTWADGINLNNGNGSTGNDSGNNLTARNNFVRGSGDDGIAINNGPSPSQEMTNTTVINNTVVAPWWANIIGVYGGENDLVANNLCTDSVKEFGIGIGLYSNWGYLDNGHIAGNTVLRGGSHGYGNQYSGLGLGGGGSNTSSTITNVVVSGNSIVNSMFDGIDVTSGSGMNFWGNTIASAGTTGLDIASNAYGNAAFVCNTTKNVASGQSDYIDGAPSSNFTVTSSGNVVDGITDVTSQTSVQRGSVLPNFSGGGYYQMDAIKNTSTASIAAPIEIVLTGLPSGVTVTNATGTYNGNPYLVTTTSDLAAGASVSVRIDFSNPTNMQFSYGVTVLSGPIN